MTAKKKYASFEAAMERLEEITHLLEGGDLPLEKSIELYTEGLEISKFCDDQLGTAEKRVKVITEKQGKMIEEDFEVEEQ
jgi:exodeoxyribonuclease VII small subunit